MTTKDHNKTLVVIYTLLGGYFALPILVAPFLIVYNIDSFRSAKSGTLVLIGTSILLSILLSLALLLLSTAFSLYKRKQHSTRLALISAVLVFPVCPPVTIYTGGVLWQKQNQLIDQATGGYNKLGVEYFKTSDYKSIVSQLGDTPINIQTQRENRAERSTIPVLREYFDKGAEHGDMPRRVKQAIQNYEKAHP